MAEIIEFPKSNKISLEEIETHWETLRLTAEGLMIIGGKADNYAKARSTRMVTDAQLQFLEQLKSGEMNGAEYVDAVGDAVLEEAYQIAGRPRPSSA